MDLLFPPRKNRRCRSVAFGLLLGLTCTWPGLDSPAGTVAWAAAEKKGAAFWHKKAVMDWTPQELQLFFQDSPWARTEKVTVALKNDAGAAATQDAPVVGAPKVMHFESCCRSFEVPMSGSNESGSESQGATTPDLSQGAVRTWTFSARVSWFSSVSFRRAMIRQRQLQGAPVESVAALAPSNDFVLALSGSFLKLLEGLPVDEVRNLTALRSSRGAKTSLVPAEYIPAQPEAEPIAYLIFPKTLKGTPAFSRDDGVLTFSMKGLDFKLECQFPLEPMMVDGSLDW